MATKGIKLGPAAQRVVSGPEPKDMDEALANAKALVDEINGPDQADMIVKVKQLDGHIFNCNGRLKTLKEELDELLEEHTAYQELVKAKEAMARAKDGLQRALMGNERYNELMEAIAAERTDIKETKYTLSAYLVEHYAQTHAHQIELDGEGQARDVVVTGKLGKPGKFQTNLFTNNDSPAAVTEGQSAMGMRRQPE
jgi:predicted RNase H-like nuclease (RuvC/YqgF family)